MKQDIPPNSILALLFGHDFLTVWDLLEYLLLLCTFTPVCGGGGGGGGGGGSFFLIFPTDVPADVIRKNQIC